MPNPQGRKPEPLPEGFTVEAWAESTTDKVLETFDEQHRNKLPRELLVALAFLSFHADNLLRQGDDTAEQAWAIFRAALTADFGFAVEFIARVRSRWFKERGADESGNIQKTVSGKRHVRPRAVENLLRDEGIRSALEGKKQAEQADILSKMTGWHVTGTMVKTAGKNVRKKGPKR